jgi:hypothetical protein
MKIKIIPVIIISFFIVIIILLRNAIIENIQYIYYSMLQYPIGEFDCANYSHEPYLYYDLQLLPNGVAIIGGKKVSWSYSTETGEVIIEEFPRLVYSHPDNLFYIEDVWHMKNPTLFFECRRKY